MLDFKLLQINMEKDSNHHAFFDSQSLLSLSKTVFPPPLELYDVVYTGKAAKINPEELWHIFNDDFPERFRGRSMSVSDVIEYTTPNNEKLYLFCDSAGFVPVDFGEKYRYRKMPEYIPGTGSHDDYVRFYYAEGEGERILNANVDFVLQGLRQGNCSSKGIDILTPSEILQIIFVSKRAKEKLTGQFTGESAYEIFSRLIRI